MDDWDGLIELEPLVDNDDSGLSFRDPGPETSRPEPPSGTPRVPAPGSTTSSATSTVRGVVGRSGTVVVDASVVFVVAVGGCSAGSRGGSTQMTGWAGRAGMEDVE